MSSKNLLNSQQFFWTNQIIKINVVRSETWIWNKKESLLNEKIWNKKSFFNCFISKNSWKNLFLENSFFNCLTIKKSDKKNYTKRN